MPRKGTSTAAGLAALKNYALEMTGELNKATEKIAIARARAETAEKAVEIYERAMVIESDDDIILKQGVKLIEEQGKIRAKRNRKRREETGGEGKGFRIPIYPEPYPLPEKTEETS